MMPKRLGARFSGSFAAVIVSSAVLMGAGRPVVAQVQTRASHLGCMAVGVAQPMHMADFLKSHPGSRTAILSYFKLDSTEVNGVVGALRSQAAVQEQMRHDFWPQIALETYGLSLSAFRQELSHPGSPVDWNVRTLAREIARYRNQSKWVFIRPFSEMNDATEDTPWEFGCREHSNTPEDFAAAWKLLRDVFDEEGATNAIFIFSPLAAHSVHREKDVLAALNKIPVGYIDAFGMNVYSRPMSAFGGSSHVPIPFSQLVAPWLNVLASSRHRGIPLAVSEMGVSKQASDTQRAAWLRQAFAFAKKHHFVMLTYFNFAHPYWQVDEQTEAGDALFAEMATDASPSGYVSEAPLRPTAAIPPRPAVPPAPMRPVRKPPAPGFVRVFVCADTGQLATEYCPVQTPRDFKKGRQPHVKCNRHRAG